MEPFNINLLLKKYFEGETTLQEEKQLKAYFSSEEVAFEYEQYKPLFNAFKNQKDEQFTKPLFLQPRKRNYVKWIGVAASVVVLFGTLLYFNNTSKEEDLGTFDNPEEAFLATQEALKMVSVNVNEGVEGMAYLNEYEKTKKTIFK